jgi:nicotinamidase-related amidase
MATSATSTALLILDMVNPFDYEGGDAMAADAERVLPRIVSLRRRFVRAGAPVIFVNDNFSHWLDDLGQLVTICRTRPGPSARIATALAPGPGEFRILKPKHSGFLATPLEILLRDLGATRLVLCGLAADACVLATAQDAKMRDYEIWIPSDAVAAMSPARRKTALQIFRGTMQVSTRSSAAVKGLFPAR